MPNVSLTLLKDATHILTLDALRNGIMPGYVNNATVTGTLIDAVTGVQVSGQSWPVALEYVSGSNGRYRATFLYGLAVTPGQRLLATVVVDAGGGLRRSWVCDVVVK